MKFIVSLERKFFSGIIGYESMGTWIYYASAIIGAVIGLLALKDSSIDGSLSISVSTEVYFISLCLGLWSMSVADAVLRIDNNEVAFKRAAFNCMAILLLMVIGAVAAIVVFFAVILLLIITILSASSLFSSKRGKNKVEAIMDQNGNMHYISSKNGDGTISTTDGKRYRKTSPNQWQEI